MNPEELLRENDRLHRSHLLYLDRLVRDKIVSPAVSGIAREIWLNAHRISKQRMAVPSACANAENGSLMYCWDTEQHHLEIDITPGAGIELFFLDLKTQTQWSDASSGDVARLFTPTLLEHLPLFHVDRGTNRRPPPTKGDANVETRP